MVPVGECLLLQVQMDTPFRDLCRKIILEHLEDVAHNRLPAIQKRTGVTSGLGTFAGLVRREPILAILFTLFLLSLTGIPPTAGE